MNTKNVFHFCFLKNRFKEEEEEKKKKKKKAGRKVKVLQNKNFDPFIFSFNKLDIEPT